LKEIAFYAKGLSDKPTPPNHHPHLLPFLEANTTNGTTAKVATPTPRVPPQSSGIPGQNENRATNSIRPS